MQSIASTLPYFFPIVILVGILWMVIQKFSSHHSFGPCKLNFGSKDEKRSDDSRNQEKLQSCSPDAQKDLRTSCNGKISGDEVFLQVRDGPISPCQNHFTSNRPQLLTSESFNFQHDVFCKTNLDVKMTSDTDTTMAEPQSTNYNSGDGKLRVLLTKKLHQTLLILFHD